MADIDRASRGGAIVGAVANLAHALDLAVVAEGVETPHERDQVREMGADLAQGYLYARPMRAEALEDLLRGPLPAAPPLLIPHDPAGRGAERPARGVSRPHVAPPTSQRECVPRGFEARPRSAARRCVSSRRLDRSERA